MFSAISTIYVAKSLFVAERKMEIILNVNLFGQLLELKCSVFGLLLLLDLDYTEPVLFLKVIS